MSLLTNKNLNYQDHYMFLSESVNIARFDKLKHKFLYSLKEKQKSFWWIPQDKNLKEDRTQFRNLSEAEQHVFLSTLRYQVLLDSLQGRSPAEVFLPLCSLPELEAWLVTWSFFETIHNDSYQHIIDNILPNPSIIYDETATHPEIVTRAKAITEHYDKLDKLSIEYRIKVLTNQSVSKEELYTLKRQIYITLASVNILEGVRFYASFACSFSFAERSQAIMEGNAKIIQEIAADEAIHLASTQHMLNAMAKGRDDPDMVQIAKECREEVIQLYKEAAEQEKVWIDFLFSKGEILGLPKESLKRYVEYLCNTRLKSIYLPPLYKVTENPLPWIHKWLTKGSGNQLAPQETELTNYVISKVDMEVGEEEDLL